MVITGSAITSLAAVQTGLTIVRVTAPPGPPAGGYQITVAEASIDVTSHRGSPLPQNFVCSYSSVVHLSALS